MHIGKYEINNNLDDKLQNDGLFLLFTNDTESTPREVIEYYKQKDNIEKLFQKIVNDVGTRKPTTHNESATRGKLFTAFLTSII
ncbi:MAG: transposase [Christensenellaceae bacterium]|nr:transposase [Christensenellaceae bacterium]